MNNHIKPWDGDKLERSKEAGFIKKYLNGLYQEGNTSFVLNLNSPWGFGKTYFLENLKIDLEEDHHPVIFFDAWQNDFSDNPLLGFLAETNLELDKFKKEIPKKAELVDAVKKNGKKILGNMLGIGLNVLAKKITGYGLENLQEQFSQINEDTTTSIESELNKKTFDAIDKIISKSLEEHQELKTLINNFKTSLEVLTQSLKDEGYQLPMYILVDELDRCRPTYAIELLENIKHIFNADDIFFIVATNQSELSHSIKAVYGSCFDANNYLKRFFNQEYKLKVTNRLDYIRHLCGKYNLLGKKWLIPNEINLVNKNNVNGGLTREEKRINAFEKIADAFNLGLRDIDQICQQLKSIELTTDLNGIHFVYFLSLLIMKFKFSKDILDYEKIEKEFQILAIQYSGFDGGRGGERIQENFSDLLKFYDKAIHMDHSKISDEVYKERAYMEYETEIFVSIRNFYNSNPEKKLNEIYLSMIDQAGNIY